MHVLNSASVHDLQLPRRRGALWTAPAACRIESSKCPKARNPNRTMQHRTRRRLDRASRQMARERGYTVELYFRRRRFRIPMGLSRSARE